MFLFFACSNCYCCYCCYYLVFRTLISYQHVMGRVYWWHETRTESFIRLIQHIKYWSVQKVSKMKKKKKKKKKRDEIEEKKKKSLRNCFWIEAKKSNEIYRQLFKSINKSMVHFILLHASSLTHVVWFTTQFFSINMLKVAKDYGSEKKWVKYLCDPQTTDQENLKNVQFSLLRRKRWSTQKYETSTFRYYWYLMQV